MARISSSRSIFGITILIGTIFFFLNSIQTLLSDFSVGGIIIMVFGTSTGYYIGQVVILKKPFIPTLVRMEFKKLVKRSA